MHSSGIRRTVDHVARSGRNQLSFQQDIWGIEPEIHFVLTLSFLLVKRAKPKCIAYPLMALIGGSDHACQIGIVLKWALKVENEEIALPDVPQTRLPVLPKVDASHRASTILPQAHSK